MIVSTLMWSPHGPPPGTGMWGDRNISMGPSSLQKMSPNQSSHHPHLGPTTLTMYSPFGLVDNRSKGPVYFDGCKPKGRVKFRDVVCAHVFIYIYGKYSCASIPHHIMVRDNIVGPLYDSSRSSTHMKPPKLQ